MNIQEVALRTGLSAHTIRFYEKSGVLPKVLRSDSGIRNFTEADVTFLEFISGLRKTGMSLPDIAEFTEDGCILERLQANSMPSSSVKRRVTILMNHRDKLLQQQREIEMVIDAVTQKLTYYESYLNRPDEDEDTSSRGSLSQR
ncbi:MerR family transcriptional regulator [Alicyclobacillus dauci]|uniref:MerR family transcriptional regulator n=1 Tax=Alicyclobacillus dauci TaxID=1475485 RepID=A0ABY6Z611_9BACL|nr:MerR family transcriptional regulator [Alicyclobacillus dauci]WAH37460.1 MerR family transcriptional regulator [Alicyclobacillus dauci]